MLNKVMLQGRIGTDIELKRTQQGVAVCSFRIAVQRDYKSGGVDTDWINIVCWRGTAEFVSKYFSKGSMVILVGQLNVREYEDKNGSKRSATEVVAESVYFGDSKRDSSPSATIVEEEDTGDLPF